MIVLLTIDVEAHRTKDEISGDKQDSLGDILAELDTAGLKATFFVDYCEVKLWGKEFMGAATQRILRGGHDLQLHAHPHHVTGDSKRWLLSEYSQEEQAQVLEYAALCYQELTGTAPTAFRAGGFGLNDATLEWLASHGITIDSSYVRERRGCGIRPRAHTVPSAAGAVREVPLAPIVTLGSSRKPLRTTPIDFNWLPLFTMKRALRQLRKDGAPSAVILLHSSSLCRRIGDRFFYRHSYRAKLRQLFRFLRDESFEVATISDAVQRLPFDHPREIEYVESNWLHQYAILLQQSLYGMFFKRNFAGFIALHVGIAFLLLILIARLA